MINKDFAEVKGIFINENYKKIIEIAFLKDGKKIKINNTLVKKTSELNNIVSALYFIPKDTNLLKDVPKNRRQFLNSNISKMNESYLKNIIQYEKLLKERNENLLIYKPVASPIDKIQNTYRWRIIIKGKLNRKAIYTINSAIGKLKRVKDVNIIVDTNPSNMM